VHHPRQPATHPHFEGNAFISPTILMTNDQHDSCKITENISNCIGQLSVGAYLILLIIGIIVRLIILWNFKKIDSGKKRLNL
jgi:hypothetical protein